MRRKVFVKYPIHQYYKKYLAGVAPPFTVESITHRVKGIIAPFGTQTSQAPENAPRFWLYRLGSTRFDPATTIEANVPYTISMPQHPDFAPQYCLGNDTVTFSATYAPVPVTVPQTATFYNTSTLHANFTAQAASVNIYAMNDRDGGSTEVTISCNTSWTLTGGTDWCHTDVKEGEAGTAYSDEQQFTAQGPQPTQGDNGIPTLNN